MNLEKIKSSVFRKTEIQMGLEIKGTPYQVKFPESYRNTGSTIISFSCSKVLLVKVWSTQTIGIPWEFVGSAGSAAPELLSARMCSLTRSSGDSQA